MSQSVEDIFKKIQEKYPDFDSGTTSEGFRATSVNLGIQTSDCSEYIQQMKSNNITLDPTLSSPVK